MGFYPIILAIPVKFKIWNLIKWTYLYKVITQLIKTKLSILFWHRQTLLCQSLKPGIHDASFASKSPFKFFDRVYHTRNLNQKTWMDLDGIEMHPIFFQFGWNLDGDWPIRKQSPYQHQLVNVNNNNYTRCAKMAGKEETPKCRKKTVTWTNEMIEDLIDFIEIHPIVTFEAIYEPMLTSFWSLISYTVQLYIIMQYKGQHPPLLPKMPFCLLYLPPKLVCIHQNFLHRVYTNLNSSFLEWRLGCKTCIVYTGLKEPMILLQNIQSFKISGINYVGKSYYEENTFLLLENNF